MNADAVDAYGRLEVEVLEYPAPADAVVLRDAVAEAIWVAESRGRLVVGCPQLHFTTRPPTPYEVEARRDRGVYGQLLYRPLDVMLVTVISRPGPPRDPEAFDPGEPAR